jgi:hypothetical protein
MKDSVARLQPVSTLLGALKDHESGVRKRAEVKIKRKDTEANHSIAEMVTEYLRQVRDQGAPPPAPANLEPVNLDKEIEAIAAQVESENPIRETELRTDPTDLA